MDGVIKLPNAAGLPAKCFSNNSGRNTHCPNESTCTHHTLYWASSVAGMHRTRSVHVVTTARLLTCPLYDGELAKRTHRRTGKIIIVPPL